MRRIPALAAACLLAACEPGVVSEQPLVNRSGGQPAEGVWALLRQGCPAPASARMGQWPDCAIAVWLDGESATVFHQGTPVHAPFLMGEGNPRLLQFKFVSRDAAKSSGIEFGPPTAPGAKPEEPTLPFYGYWAFQPEGNAPYRRGKTWQIQCPDREMPGLEKSDDGCLAKTLDGLRSVAGPPSQAETILDAVWIADAQ
jgi:hypothetical protein